MNLDEGYVVHSARLVKRIRFLGGFTGTLLYGPYTMYQQEATLLFQPHLLNGEEE